ncbi:vacuolar sorting-associated 13c [Brachionus plicatilis]|uniref:Vacuolar sorting-associated 13c n=1 Tax=Brachionus plicatilis TaxID=10195 RepID=A0A3M7QI54_BRAPC|nr:vacuolar sorting-associated 13c [Brachionus plicatilis]
MESVMGKDFDFRELLKKGDLAIFDSRFKECIARLRSIYSLNCKIPAFIKEGNKQLTWSEANETRLVTKCRYVVIEVINGIFKQQFKALKETQNTMLSHITDDYRKASALINVFFCERISDKGDVKEIAEAMKILRLSCSQNSFTKILNYEIDGFPKFDQLQQAYGYLSEHFDSNEDYEIFVCNNLTNDEDAKIILCMMQSRHSNQLRYKIFVRYKQNSTNVDDITRVCSCKTGKRSFGCCSHVASVIYFMSYGRYNLLKIPRPGLKIKNFLIPITNESDQEEEVSTSNETMKRSLSINSEIENNLQSTKK